MIAKTGQVDISQRPDGNILCALCVRVCGETRHCYIKHRRRVCVCVAVTKSNGKLLDYN